MTDPNNDDYKEKLKKTIESKENQMKAGSIKIAEMNQRMTETQQKNQHLT